MPHFASEISSIPLVHRESLHAIDKNYWWYRGRLDWVTEWGEDWLKQTSKRESVELVDLGGDRGSFALDLCARLNIRRAFCLDSEIPTHPIHDSQLKFIHTDFREPFSLPESQLPGNPQLLTCLDVIEHLCDDESFLLRIYQQMTPASLFLITAPALPGLYSEWDRKLGHYRRYLKSDLIFKLKKAGFKVWRSAYFWSFLTPGAPFRSCFRSQKNLKFPKTSPRMNEFLTRAAEIERKLAKWVPAPFGTSIIVGAQKL